MQKSYEWYNRLSIELHDQDSAAFVTLTYADEYLPINEDGVAEASKADIQTWMDRVRKRNKRRGRPHPRYYIVAEEGPEWNRPHYHGIIFGVLKEHREEVLKWDLGWSTVKDVKSTRIRYVTDYLLKKKPTEWALMSKRPMIGHKYLEENKDWHQLTLNHEMRIKGKSNLPRSWYNHLGLSDADIEKMQKQKLADAIEYFYKQSEVLIQKGDPLGTKMKEGIEFEKLRHLQNRNEL